MNIGVADLHPVCSSVHASKEAVVVYDCADKLGHSDPALHQLGRMGLGRPWGHGQQKLARGLSRFLVPYSFQYDHAS